MYIKKELILRDTHQYANKNDWRRLDDSKIEIPLTCLCCMMREVDKKIICNVGEKPEVVLSHEKFDSKYRTKLTDICNQFVFDVNNSKHQNIIY